MDLLPKLHDTICRYALLTPGEKVLLALSGGADSTAMFDLLVRFSQKIFPLSLALAYLDHGLRAEAVQECEYIASLARAQQLPFFTDRIELRAEGEHAMEEKGRRLRYQFLTKTAMTLGAAKIAVAHHADDQAETLLMHLFQGCGIHGLAAMAAIRPVTPVTSVYIIRPLLQIHKEELLAYLLERGILWYQDATNTDLRYTRNQVRGEIIPYLQTHGYPHLPGALARTAHVCREIATYLDTQGNIFFQSLTCNSSPLRPDDERFRNLLSGEPRVWAAENAKWDALPSVLLPFLLRRILEHLGVSEISLRENHYQMLQQLTIQGKGTVRLRKDLFMVRWGKMSYLVYEENLLSILPQNIDVPGTSSLSPHAVMQTAIEEHTESVTPFAFSLLEARLDADNVALPLTARFYQPGDVVRPLGSTGRRKVAEVLQDIRVLPALRASTVVVSDANGEIVWLPGICIAHHCRITTSTVRIIAMRVGPSTATKQCE